MRIFEELKAPLGKHTHVRFFLANDIQEAWGMMPDSDYHHYVMERTRDDIVVACKSAETVVDETNTILGLITDE